VSQPPFRPKDGFLLETAQERITEKSAFLIQLELRQKKAAPDLRLITRPQNVTSIRQNRESRNGK
jgi:hypothetical protein